MIDEISGWTNYQLHAVAVAVEDITIINRDEANQARFNISSQHKYWSMRFPAYPLGVKKEERPFVLFEKELLRGQEVIKAEFRDPQTPRETGNIIDAKFAINYGESDPKKAFVKLPGDHTSQSIFDWLLEQYDTHYIQRRLGLPSMLKLQDAEALPPGAAIEPERPVAKSGQGKPSKKIKRHM